MLKFCSLSLVGARGWTPRPAKPAPLVPFKASASFNKPCQSAGTQPAALHQSSSVSVQSAKLCVLHRTCVDCSLLPLYLSTLACVPASASATESITYTPGAGADVVKNVAGLAYVALLAFWLFKVVGRRVKRSTTERLANERDPDAEEELVDEDNKEVTAGAAALGAIQAAFFTYLLFLFSTNISKYFGGQDLPDQYTARNITVTIRTAVGGLAYLATFIFGANALGLAGQAPPVLLPVVLHALHESFYVSFVHRSCARAESISCAFALTDGRTWGIAKR
ncbi:hypothetical protein ABBQ32_005046 [Trebouxia sp. C0010 RCD-2024]